VPGAIRRPALPSRLRQLEPPPAPTAPRQRPRGASPNYVAAAGGFIAVIRRWVEKGCSARSTKPAA
jgi:hypothetical protein